MKKNSMEKFIFLLLCSLVWLVACSDSSTTPNPTPLEPVEQPQTLSTERETTSFVIENTSGESLDYTISVSNDDDNPQDGNWFDITPERGTLRGGQRASVTLTLKSGLAEGRYKATLMVDYGTGSTPFDVEGVVGAVPEGSFTLETDGATNALSPGAEVRVPITIARQGGFTGAVDFEILGAPNGLSGTFSPNPASGDQSTLTVSVAQSVAAGAYTLSVRGTSGGESATTDVTVNVVGTTSNPTFSLALSPASVRVKAGERVTSQVKVQKTASFSGDVTLSAENVPDGVSVSFDPKTTGSSSQVRLSVEDDAAAGSYTLTIVGKGSGKTSRTNLGLTVTSEEPDDNDSGTATIRGTARTDAFLSNFSVPSSVTGTTTNLMRASLADTTRPEYVPGQLLVQYQAGLNAQGQGASVQQAFTSLSNQVATEYDLTILQSGSFDTPSLVEVAEGESVPETAARLSRDPNVAYAEPNHYIYPLSVPNDPQFDEQWNLAVSGVPVAWDARNSANNITVAVLDSGFALNHPDLRNVFVSNGYDFCGNASCSSDADVSPDVGESHGTHVTGIIAAAGNNNRGVTGVLSGGASILPVKVFYDYPEISTEAAVVAAIDWAAGIRVSGTPTNSNPADIINLSLGLNLNSSSTALEDAVKRAQDRGVLVIAASGNDGANRLRAPASYDGVFAVGSVNSRFGRSCFSNYGAGLDVVAAGGDGFACTASGGNETVISTVPGGYGTLAGTSQATPLVTGLAALIWSQNRSLSASQVAQRLRDSAYRSGQMSSSQYGAGVVRADVAFGYPKPGDDVSITAGTNALTTATLRADGSTESFTLENLKAGTYTVEADASGATKSLSASQRVTLNSGESKSVTLRLKP